MRSAPPLRFRPGRRLHGRSEEHNELQVQVFRGIVGYLEAMNTQPFEAESCKAHMYSCLQGMAALRALWRTDLEDPTLHHGSPWHLRPKAHMLHHLVEEKLPLWGSPKNFWCYGDESFVGAIKNVAAGSRHPATLEDVAGKKCMLLAGVDAYALAMRRRQPA